MTADMAAKIGRNIANARETAGISQRELGRRIGASSAIVPMWEAGQCAPGAEYLLAVSEVLHVPVGTLLGQQYANPETEQAVTWWAGWREGWRQCAENVRAAAAMNPARFPPTNAPAMRGGGAR